MRRPTKAARRSKNLFMVLSRCVILLVLTKIMYLFLFLIQLTAKDKYANTNGHPDEDPFWQNVDNQFFCFKTMISNTHYRSLGFVKFLAIIRLGFVRFRYVFPLGFIK